MSDGTRTTPLTRSQRHALDLMKRARETEPATDDGLYYGGPDRSFYDREIHVAYVHCSTANALRRKGLIIFGPTDPEWGTSLTLTEAAYS